MCTALNLCGVSVPGPYGALHALYEQPIGKLLLAIVAVVLFGYAVRSLIQAILDPEHQGTDAKGVVARVAYGLVGFSYAAQAVAAAQLVFGTGSGAKSSDTTTKDWTARLLTLPFGPLLVILVGLIIIGVAGYRLYRAYTADLEKSLALREVGTRARRWIVAPGCTCDRALGAARSTVLWIGQLVSTRIVATVGGDGRTRR